MRQYATGLVWAGCGHGGGAAAQRRPVSAVRPITLGVL